MKLFNRIIFALFFMGFYSNGALYIHAMQQDLDESFSDEDLSPSDKKNFEAWRNWHREKAKQQRKQKPNDVLKKEREEEVEKILGVEPKKEKKRKRSSRDSGKMEQGDITYNASTEEEKIELEVSDTGAQEKNERKKRKSRSSRGSEQEEKKELKPSSSGNREVPESKDAPKPVTEDSINNDLNLLRNISKSIINRQQTITIIKEKLVFKHGNEMFNFWKQNKKWKTSNPNDKLPLEKHGLNKGDVENVENRTTFVLLTDDLLQDPIPTVNEIVEKGDITVSMRGAKQDIYSIEVKYDLVNRLSGYKYPNRNPQKRRELTKIYVSFNVTDIYKKMINNQNYKWNRNIDGAVTTVSPTD